MPFTKGDPNINRKGRIDGGGGLKAYDTRKFNAMNDLEKEEFLEKVAPELRYRMAEGNPHQTQDQTIEVTLPEPLLPDVEDASIKNNSNREAPKTDKED